MKTVLITGVAGFLGRHVARHFAREGWRVTGVDDVPPENAPLAVLTSFTRLKLPTAAFSTLLQEDLPAVCVHCAGRASVGLSLEDPAADFRDNTVLTFEVLEALRRAAPRCRFIFLSSAAVYGDPARLPVSESQPTSPLSPYGFHKLQGELLCAEFSKIYGVPTTSARVFSAYGPGLRRQVIWDIFERVLSTGALALRGTGAESRDFIHAADIARALHCLAGHAHAEGEVYNVGSGRQVTVADLAKQILAALGSDVQAAFDGAATPGNPLNWVADISRLEALGFRPLIPLEEGLQAVAAWTRAELAQT